ncbi:MAG: DUF6323 family protein [Bacillota bacterium]
MMEENLFPLHTRGALRSEMAQLAACNDFTVKYGLMLSESQLQRLEEARRETLRVNGRVEFGGGVLKKLIYAFCDSPYVQQQGWEDTLAELQDIFYTFKNEADDRLSDDELIEFMKKTFDGVAQGSLDYLAGTALEELCRNARHDLFDRDEEPEDE